MSRSGRLAVIMSAVTIAATAFSESIPVRHLQKPMHRFMVARTEDGKTVASGEFSQVVQGSEVTMRFTYRFADGSLDDEVTTYTQQGTFRLLRDHHLQKGPFFTNRLTAQWKSPRAW